jgi:hypothetical protein
VWVNQLTLGYLGQHLRLKFWGVVPGIRSREAIAPRCNRYIRYKRTARRRNVANSQPLKLHITVRRVWLSGRFLPLPEPALAASNSARPPAVNQSTEILFQVRRHKHEEDVATRGASCSHALDCRLLLLSLASPAGALPAALPPTMPTALPAGQPVRNSAGYIWCTGCSGRAVFAAAAMVSWPWESKVVAEVVRLQILHRIEFVGASSCELR